VIVFFLLLAVATPITPGERLDRATGALEALEFAQAADEAGFVISDPAATEQQRIDANLIAGTANRVVGRDVEARLNFRYVLNTRPEFCPATINASQGVALL
jgi:hypothetical protein